jgi:hypothetical protein
VNKKIGIKTTKSGQLVTEEERLALTTYLEKKALATGRQTTSYSKTI